MKFNREYHWMPWTTRLDEG